MSTSGSAPPISLPILEENPYTGHPELSALESDVLWEYAKMAALVKQLANTTRNLANDPSNDLLAKLRIVERQMGLVLTLFKASVWSTIVSAEAEEDEADRTDSGYDTTVGPSGIPRPGSRARSTVGGETIIHEDSYYDDPTPQPRYR
ncbi:hypothetical protein FRC04_005561 [Tulasnella sp. 424]|nr:hypothetical protein FRC04_005561 [Tulasnella sp. 424]KAG8961137.1 hypothetical protein FRC05_006370 [Tulasnella sp. 425]